jgi:Tryptophan-associated transmembrane protein (Trp_oprn_chp)
MRAMSTELLSTGRPTRLRLAGFLVLVAGCVLAGIGATREWATIGFVADAERAADVSVYGTDIWEGKVVLLIAGVALVAMIVMRIAISGALRRSLGVALVVLGVVCTTLPTLAAVRADARFGGGEGLDRMARILSARLELPEDVIREQLADQFRRDLRVEIGPGVWLSIAGGLLIVAGGALGLAWARTREPRVPSV